MNITKLNDIQDQAYKTFQYAGDKAQELSKKGFKEMEKGGKDWLNYVEDHPLQSIGFALIGYFALKGLLK